MKEKIMAFFQDEKVKRFTKRVLNKKTLITAIVILVIVSALKISFLLMFEVKGTVKNIDGTNITIANFLTTRTVDVGNYPIEQIQIGDRIEVTKNLSGDILYIKDENSRHTNKKANINNNGNKLEKSNYRGGKN
jgi:hypothetical protein